MAPFTLPDLPRCVPAPDAPVDATAVAAALITEDGRFLLQLRDPKPDIVLPDHWAFFAGSVEENESPDEAILREMEEEIGWRPPAARWLFEMVWAMPRPQKRLIRRIWYVIDLPLARLPHLVLGEGAAMRLFTLDEMLQLEKIAPWDLAIAMTAVRHDVMFPPAPLG